MFNILHLWMLFFRCIVFLSKSWEIFYHVPNSTLENLKPIQLHGKVYDPSNSIPQACMFIFSVRETLASEGGWVCHKNTLLLWYSRGYTFGFLSSIALTFNKRLIFRYLIYKHKCTHHSCFLNWGSCGTWAQRGIQSTLQILFQCVTWGI